MLLRTWEGWLQQRGKWDFVGERAKAKRERITPNAKKWDFAPCQSGDNRFIWLTALNACHQHATILSIATCTAGHVRFLSGNEHVLFFLEPRLVLAPHKAGSAKTSCSLLLQPAICDSETSVGAAPLIYCSCGVWEAGKGSTAPKLKHNKEIKDVATGTWSAKYIKG